MGADLPQPVWEGKPFGDNHKVVRDGSLCLGGGVHLSGRWVGSRFAAAWSSECVWVGSFSAEMVRSGIIARPYIEVDDHAISTVELTFVEHWIEPTPSVPAAAPTRPRDYQAARSVHLRWEPPAGDICAFYNKVCVQKSATGSYFMACGFNGGYFGIQELCDGKRRVLFSVWDAGSGMNQGRDDPTRVQQADRVAVLRQGQGVHIQRFGGEGTGAQCFDDFCGWKVGEPVAFLVQFRPAASGGARYAAHCCRGAGGPWRHLATFGVTSPSPFRGFYSFVEDFKRNGASVLEERRAHFGPAWFSAGCDDAWGPAVSACFTASGAEWERPDNVGTCAGPGAGSRTLATGGPELAGGGELGRSFPLLGRPEDGPPFDLLARLGPV